MNAEKIEYESEIFDQSIIFFLLHEVSAAARANILAEAIRITKPGGRLYITEYNEGFRHYMHKVPLFTWFSGVIEPCLPGFWKEKLADKIEAAARAAGKTVALTRSREVWHGFYRIHEYTVG
jgi:ubiquinone/menaquinone biosynthesis C-methylase UbiE